MCKESVGPSTTQSEPRFKPSREKLSFTQGRFYNRLRYFLRYPLSNSITKVVTFVVSVTVINHAMASFWTGPDHPLNRYRLGTFGVYTLIKTF